MPAISTIFNRFLSVIVICVPLFGGVSAQSSQLSPAELHWLGLRIYSNECNQQPSCLTSWNEGEEFPSLGIGHFIWFPADSSAPFTETFPQLIAYYQTQGITVPAWLAALPELDAPWQDRPTFLADLDSSRMNELRQFLATTTDTQVAFIVQRLDETLPSMLAAAPARQRADLQAIYEKIGNAAPPMGRYALIDYVHFKGSGANSSERYRGQGWGLLQVLQRMDPATADLPGFVTAAEAVLRQRVALSAPERNEQRWLQGWINRLQTYLPDPA